MFLPLIPKRPNQAESEGALAVPFWACRKPRIRVLCSFADDARDVRIQVGFAPTFYFALEDMDKYLIVEHVTGIATKVAATGGIELVHVDIAGTKRDLVVRIYIDKEGGVTIEDCTIISRGVEEVLDSEDFIPSRYVLEVSSPGIERELYSLGDFVKFTGQLAKVKVKTGIDGQKTFVGTITEVDGESITIDDRTKGVLSFEYSEVDKANLKIDLSKEFSGR